MDATKVKRSQGFALGALAIIAGIFSGEITANLHSGWKTPVDTLGGWIISVIPHAVEKLAISAFGVHDKGFLVATILLVAILLGGVAGAHWQMGRSSFFYFVIALETGFSVATVLARPHVGIGAIFPSLVSGLVPLIMLYVVMSGQGFGKSKSLSGERSSIAETPSWVSQSGEPPFEVGDSNNSHSHSQSELTPEPTPQGVESLNGLKTRRQVFQFAGAAAVLGGVMVYGGAGIKSRSLNLIKKLAIKLPSATKPLPPLPVDPALHVPGLSKLITPNDEFYQIDTAINAPIIDASTWKLTITGMVKKPITLTYEELLNRPLFELDDTISCVSNPVGGPLVGNARWLGCRLDDLIREAGPLANADQILSSSDDGFAAGFPLSTLDGRDAMIAVGMNGEALPVKHGYPARIIVPGLYGYVSATKWVTNIELTRFDIKQGFWISRGWSALAPIKMESRIDSPQDGANLTLGQNRIVGVAWAPDLGVSAVQVSIDGRWENATLGPALSGTSWRQWWITWTPTSGNHTIMVRAIDAKGNVQTSDVAEVAPNGASGWHTINVSS